MNGPVDIVYLWVDGQDPAWRARHRAAYAQWAIQHPGQLALHGNVAGRYRDNGELRYNLRALERFFPGHGHVYLVTDRQVPAWLRACEGLSVIDHRQLMPACALPVFDSAHIESYLHHIPGLAERFLYFNDDVFLGQRFDAGYWFGDCLRVCTEAALVELPAHLRADVAAPVNCAVLSRDWLGARDPDYRHEPRLFAQVRATVFRSWRAPALLPDLVPRWMVAQGLARSEVLDPLHIASGDADAPVLLAQLRAQFGSLPFFCINDTCDEAENDDPRLARVAATLRQLLPQPSRFEVDVSAPWADAA